MIMIKNIISTVQKGGICENKGHLHCWSNFRYIFIFTCIYCLICYYVCCINNMIWFNGFIFVYKTSVRFALSAADVFATVSWRVRCTLYILISSENICKKHLSLFRPSLVKGNVGLISANSPELYFYM